MNLRTGHVYSPPSPTDRQYAGSEIAGANPSAAAGADVDYRSWCAPIADQLGNNCCAHAFREGAFAMKNLAGSPIPLPGVMPLYAGARQLAAGPGVALVDGGSSLKLMGDFALAWGLVREDRWPESIDAMNDAPPDDVMREGSAAPIGALHRIPSGPGCGDAILDALRKRLCPMPCMAVDDAWANVGSGVWTGPGGNVLGGHCQLAVGYVASLDAFVIQNSWGLTFGVGGFGLLSRQACDSCVYECWVLDAVSGGLT